MIELYTLEGEPIELASNEITLELNNSLFNDGVNFKGSLSYPIDLAATPKNRRLLGFPDLLEKSLAKDGLPVHLRAGSKLLKRSLLKIDSISEKGFVAHLKLDIGIISDHIRETKLTSLKLSSLAFAKTHNEARAHIFAAIRNTDWRKIPYTFIPTKNPDFFKDPDIRKAAPVINAFYDGAFTNYFMNNLQPTVPYLYLPYILTQLAQSLGFALKGDFAMHAEVEKIVLYSPQALSSYTLLPAKHLPAISIADFFKSLSSFFCCRIKIDEINKTMDISWKKSVFEKPTYRDWREKVITITKQQAANTGGYTLSAQVNDKLDSSTKEKDEIIIGDGKLKIEAKAGTLEFVQETISGGTQQWKIPTDKREGNTADAVFPLRFLFNQGFTTYPISSYESPAFNLKMSGDRGLHRFAHRAWLKKTFFSKLITCKVLLNEHDLHSLRDEDIIRIRSASGTTVECLLKKLTFSSKHYQKLIPAEAELVVLKLSDLSESG